MNGISRAFIAAASALSAFSVKAAEAFKTDNEIGSQFPVPLDTGGWRGFVSRERNYMARAGNNGGKGRPHQGAREKARRLRQMIARRQTQFKEAA